MTEPENAEEFVLAESEEPGEVEETSVVEDGNVVETAPPDPKQAAYDYFRSNPEEHRALLRAAEAMYQPAPAQTKTEEDPFPDWDDPKFQDYTSYNRAVAEWTRKSVERQVEDRVSALRGAYDPIVAPQAVQTAINRIAGAHNVPDEGKAFLEKQLAGLPASAISQIDGQTAEILAYAARGYAADQAAKTGSNGRVRHAEPVAGTGPSKLQLADGVSRSDVDAYLRLTGKQLTRETISELKDGGYLK